MMWTYIWFSLRLLSSDFKMETLFLVVFFPARAFYSSINALTALAFLTIVSGSTLAVIYPRQRSNDEHFSAIHKKAHRHHSADGCGSAVRSNQLQISSRWI